MSSRNEQIKSVLDSYKPLPTHMPKDCPDIHPDDFFLLDANAIPEIYIDVANAWNERLATGGRDAVLQLAELFWDLTWKASE